MSESKRKRKNVKSSQPTGSLSIAMGNISLGKFGAVPGYVCAGAMAESADSLGSRREKKRCMCVAYILQERPVQAEQKDSIGGPMRNHQP